MEPAYDKSIEFLRQWAPGGPWVLTSIAAEKGGATETRTFWPADEAAALGWLRQQGAKRNLYWMPNPPIRPLSEKASRDEVAALVCLHVDIDPRAKEEFVPEQRRILSLLTDTLPPNVPPPTLVLASGGGYWGFWRLRTPIQLGTIERAEDAKLYNLALELAFKADSCHNVDRICRLPGSVNRPSKAKRAKGQVDAVAEVIAWFPERVYDIEQFEKSRPLGESAPQRPSLASVSRLTSLDALPEQVSDETKVIIQQGHDPNETTKHNSRSEWLMRVCCDLVRAGCDDATVFSIITDPAFGISASVLDKGRNIERYAVRQVERAKDFANTDPVSQINRDYFALLEGGRVTFYREEPGGGVSPMNAEAFDFELADRSASVDDGKGGQRQVPASRLWRQSARRRYFPGGFILDPDHGHADGKYNLWKGFGIQPAAGDWSLMRTHIESVLAAGNAAHADYILRWAAWSVQNPAKPPRVALVFRGDEGVGKGVFCNALVEIFGHHGQRAQSMLQVAGRFNAHMRHCCLLFADEVALVADEQEGTLKGMITEGTLPIEGKGKDLVQAENHLHVVMASNRDWVIPAGIGARRFAMFDVSSCRKGDSAYFDALWLQLKSGGLAAMLQDLLAMDLGPWHPETARPSTAALTDQKIKSLPPIARTFFECLATATLPLGAERGDGGVFLPTRRFLDHVRQVTRREEVSDNDVAALFGPKKLKFEKRDKSRPRGWEVPPLAAARRAWDEAMFPVEWDGAPEWMVEYELGSPGVEVAPAPLRRAC